MAKVIQGKLKGDGKKFGLVASRFNEFITNKLLSGAIDCLERHGVAEKDIDVYWVPGSFEMPLAAKRVAGSGKYDAVVCLGAVIRGATPHFEYVAAEAAKGIAQVGLSTGVPTTFGVLTTVAAFMPLLFAVGTMGQVVTVIATTVISCLVFSLIESQMVLPAHLGNTKVESVEGEVGLMLVPIIGILLLGVAPDMRSYIALAIAIATAIFALHAAGLFKPVAERLMQIQRRFAAWLESFIDVQFRSVTQRALAARYVTVSIAFVALLSAVGIVASGRLPFSFFPPLASDQVMAKLTMPLGTSATKTEEAIQLLEQSARELKASLNEQYPAAPPVTHIMAAVGEQPSSTAVSYTHLRAHET